MSTTVTSGDILAGIRRKYPKYAVVREVVLRDPIEQAINNRAKIESSFAFYTEEYFAALNEPVAEAVPAGWNYQLAKFERRIDALMLDSAQRTAIEIKVTRADFRRDTDLKRRAWRDHSHRFIYAVPRGLLTADEIPDGCGLWEFDPLTREIVSTKRAKVNRAPLDLPAHVVHAMFYRVSNYERSEGRSRRA